MEEFVISSFRYGVDTRKDVLTAQPGTLVTCENGHINPGGEIEKRKAFVEFADVLILDDSGATGTFGIEVTDVGVVVFGSALPFGTTPSQLQPVLVSAMPVGITYQQLKHPKLYQDEEYDAAFHRMTQVIFSDNYNGKSFVGAKFSDGNTFLYYDGSLVRQSANGVTLDAVTLSNLAIDLLAEVRAIGWDGTSDEDENAATELGSVIVKSPQTDYFTPLPSSTSVAGRIGVKNISQDGAATHGTKAIAGFKVTLADGTFDLSAPTESDGSGTVELCGAPVVAAATAALTVVAIAQAVNDLTNVHGYSAISNGDSVFIYASPDLGDMTGDLVVTVTTGTVGAAGTAPGSLLATITPSPLTVVKALTKPGTFVVSGIATIAASGGTAPYTFAWSEATTGSGNGIAITNSTSAVATFSKSLFNNTQVTGNFKCVVTDATAATTTTYLTVSLATTYKTGA